jgi:serine phosphatase RsbU (regulator of sigma subunit)
MSSIVVIEDDPSILRGLADTLRSESYDVLTSPNGEDGYQLVLDNQPDLVILDLMLPGLSGFEVCRQIRRHGLMTPILMLSAQNQELSRVRGFEAGADDYVTKPFSIRELLGRVRAILRRSEGRSDLENQRELDDARRIQQGLMPTEIPQFHGLRIAGSWRPARMTSGDYFDVLKLENDAVAVCIADVCGKGMPAALMMAALQATVKAYASMRIRPSELCQRVNRVMCENIARQGFISLFYAVITPAHKRMTYCNAGHNPPILLSSANEPSRLARGGGILGAFDHWQYEDGEVRLRSGDRILMYTDGITENRNSAGEEFGEQRLVDLLLHCKHHNVDTLTAQVMCEVSRFSNGSFEDDLTLVAVSVD